MFQGGIPLVFRHDCVLTATYLINMLPSSFLSGKSPFSLIYGREPSLAHLRSFGCLCYATILKESDKFSEKSEKCVLLGYANGKKAYKLLSLENRSILYSRDVKFYETIFPYKMKQSDLSESNLEVNNLNFFDNFESKTRTPSPSPNDENLEEVREKVTSVEKALPINLIGLWIMIMLII
jgi:hypothetical protein